MDMFDDIDPNELPFNPVTDHRLEECQDWFMSSYVEKSHFKFIKIIGIGSHSVIWLVQKRISKKEKIQYEKDKKLNKDLAAENI
jgi:hypothetical protein